MNLFIYFQKKLRKSSQQIYRPKNIKIIRQKLFIIHTFQFIYIFCVIHIKAAFLLLFVLFFPPSEPYIQKKMCISAEKSYISSAFGPDCQTFCFKFFCITIHHFDSCYFLPTQSRSYFVFYIENIIALLSKIL